MIDQELSNEEDAEDMVDRHEYAEEELETVDQDDLQESDEIDLSSLFEYEDEEINLDEESVKELAEKLTLDFEPEKSGS